MVCFVFKESIEGVQMIQSTSYLKIDHCEIPQRSNLGPFRFLLYINDLPNSLKKCNPSMNADDTSLSVFERTVKSLSIAHFK